MRHVVVSVVLLVTLCVCVEALRHARHKGALHDGLFWRGTLQRTGNPDSLDLESYVSRLALGDGPQAQWFDQVGFENIA